MKAIHLLNAFLAGCIAFTFLGWIAFLHPVSFKVCTAILCCAFLIWSLAWLLDDTLTEWLNISHQNWQAVLIGSLFMMIIGLGVALCS